MCRHTIKGLAMGAIMLESQRVLIADLVPAYVDKTEMVRKLNRLTRAEMPISLIVFA